MSMPRTPSFIVELALRVSQAEATVMLARLEAARQVYNACLGESLKRCERLLHSALAEQGTG